MCGSLYVRHIPVLKMEAMPKMQPECIRQYQDGEGLIRTGHAAQMDAGVDVALGVDGLLCAVSALG